MKSYQQFFHQFMLVYRPFINELNTLLAKHDLFSSQWSIMYIIHMYGSASLVEISNYLYVEKPTITRTVNRLIELNYVEHFSGNDKREKRVKLTNLGNQVYADVRHTIDLFEEAIMKGIPEQDQQNVIRILGEVRENIVR